MATIQVFTSNGLRAVMGELAPAFERASGHSVAVSYDPAKIMLRRIQAGETADLAIIGGTAVDDLTRQGKISASTRRAFARCGVGLAVRVGARKPDIGTIDAFKQALLAAKSVAYTQEGASGIHFSGVIERLGIAEQVQAKAVRQPGGLVGELVAAGKAEIAIQQIPELLAVPGIELVGPLPHEVQAVTVSTAGIFAASRQPEAARALLDFLTTSSAARVLRARGLEPEFEG